MLRSGSTTTSRSASGASSTATAGRLRRPGWREPRLLVGLGLVVVAIAATTATTNGISRLCPWMIGGSQAPIDGGVYRKPTGDKPEAWPSYWDGRWFVQNSGGASKTRSPGRKPWRSPMLKPFSMMPPCDSSTDFGRLLEPDV